MQPISPAINNVSRSRRAGSSPHFQAHGFTLAEVMMVTAVLIIVAAILLPNVVASVETRNLKNMEGDVARLPIEARNQAVKSQANVDIRVFGTTLIMEQQQPQQTGSGAPQQTGGSAQQIKSIDLGTNLSVQSARLNGQPSDPSSWIWTAYPDGSTDAGGLQFSEGQKGATDWALTITGNGEVKWAKGDLPVESGDTWPAGNLAQRSS